MTGDGRHHCFAFLNGGKRNLRAFNAEFKAELLVVLEEVMRGRKLDCQLPWRISVQKHITILLILMSGAMMRLMLTLLLHAHNLAPLGYDNRALGIH